MKPTVDLITDYGWGYCWGGSILHWFSNKDLTACGKNLIRQSRRYTRIPTRKCKACEKAVKAHREKVG